MKVSAFSAATPIFSTKKVSSSHSPSSCSSHRGYASSEGGAWRALFGGFSSSGESSAYRRSFPRSKELGKGRRKRRKKKEVDQRGQNSLEMRWQKTHLFGAGWTVDADDVNEMDKVEDEGG